MNILYNSLLPLSQVLGWTVVHSLWQIILIYPVYKGLVWLFNRHNRTCYGIGLLALATTAGWSVHTFLTEFDLLMPGPACVGSASFLTLQAQAIAFDPAPPEFALSYSDQLAGWFAPHAVWVGWIWCLGLCWMVIRLVAGYWLAQRLRYRGVSKPDDGFIQSCLEWSTRLGIRRTVQLLESPYITEPLTLGFWKPAVLFPAGMLLQLTPDQVECLLVHELAHIRRYDYLVNLIQLALEACFFYHPLFWLISREVRTRREYCCDDVVLHYTTDRMLYAHTLTTLKLNSIHLQNAITMKATGNQSFSARIFRIAGITPKRSNRTNLLLVLLLLGSALTAVVWPVVTNATPEEKTEVQAVIPPVGIASDSVPPKTMPRFPTKTAVAAPVPPEGDVRENPTEPKIVAVEAAKMNVMYIGVDNPLQIAVDGIPAGEIRVRVKNMYGEISGSNGIYNARFSTPGEAKIEVYREKNGKEDLLGVKSYRIKRIPDPVPNLSGRRSGTMPVGKFTPDLTVSAILENFDFDAVCEIVGYEITILPPKEDPITYQGYGSQLPESVLNRIKTFTEGYSIFIDDIKAKCPGDAAVRNLGGLVFKLRNE